MYCKRCGQEIPQSSAFCTYCGAPVSAQSAQQRPAYRPNERYDTPPRRNTQQSNINYNDRASWNHAAQYSNQNSAAQPKQPKWKLPAIIALCCVLAVTLVVATILVMNILNGKPDTPTDPDNISSSSTDSGNDTQAPIDPEDPDMPADPSGAEEDDTPVRNDLPLVTDAFYDDSHRTSYGGGVFAIPQINLEGKDIASINEEIYRELYTNLAAELLRDWEKNMRSSESISYTWSETGDTLSLLIKVRPVDWEWTDYYVYNVSISKGTKLSDSEVIDRSGVTNYRRTAKQALETTFWEYYTQSQMDASMIEFFNQQLDETRSDSTIDDAKPYFNQSGELCVIAKIYSLAGAAYYLNEINLEDYDYDPKYAGYAEVPSSDDDYIIPDSDSRKISQSELYGLSEHECWLALNEIYARHGRLFARQEFADYFNSKPWYNGYIDGTVFDKNLNRYLNSTEQENIATIVAYQKAKGWR